MSEKSVNAESFKPHRQQSLIQAFFLDMWYQKRLWAWLLLPLSWLYQILSAIYRRYARKHLAKIAAPVVVVGNISVGGTGKTPVIIALAKALTAQGLKVGIISRGYGSQAPHYPYEVNPHDSAHIAGDEPLLIAKASDCAVVIDKNRVAAAKHLLKTHPDTALILSDDGLQHHRLDRDMEIVVVDSARGLGNHLCLPAGPLREPARRLASVDWILLNQSDSTRNSSTRNNSASDNNARAQNSEGEQSPNPKEGDKLCYVHMTPTAWRHVHTQQTYPLSPLPWGALNYSTKAVAGIGHPERFFNSLHKLGVDCDAYAFDDHHQFTEDDFAAWGDEIILMTEKDAVKCRDFTHQQLWSLVVDIHIPEKLLTSIVERVASH